MKHPTAAAAWGGNRLDIFGLGTDNQMWQKAWTGNAWGPSPTSWTPLGGKFTNPPAAVALSPDSPNILCQGPGKQRDHKTRTAETRFTPSDTPRLRGKDPTAPAPRSDGGPD